MKHTRPMSILISKCSKKTPNMQLSDTCYNCHLDITSTILAIINILLIVNTIPIICSLDKKTPSVTLGGKVTKTMASKTLSTPSTLLRRLSYCRLLLRSLVKEVLGLVELFNCRLGCSPTLEWNLLSDGTLREISKSCANWNASETEAAWYELQAWLAEYWAST